MVNIYVCTIRGARQGSQECMVNICVRLGGGGGGGRTGFPNFQMLKAFRFNKCIYIFLSNMRCGGPGFESEVAYYDPSHSNGDIVRCSVYNAYLFQKKNTITISL